MPGAFQVSARVTVTPASMVNVASAATVTSSVISNGLSAAAQTTSPAINPETGVVVGAAIAGAAITTMEAIPIARAVGRAVTGRRMGSSRWQGGCEGRGGRSEQKLRDPRPLCERFG